MEETINIKSKNVVFSFIEVYRSICFVDAVVHLRNRIQISNNDNTHTLPTAPLQGAPMTSQSNTCSVRDTAMY